MARMLPLAALPAACERFGRPVNHMLPMVLNTCIRHFAWKMDTVGLNGTAERHTACMTVSGAWHALPAPRLNPANPTVCKQIISVQESCGS